MNNINVKYVTKYLSEHINLAQFLETDIGLDMKWNGEESAVSVCPLHNDTVPSFHVSNTETGWKFYCFGCQAGGGIVNFFEAYYGLNFRSAITGICEHFDIKETSDIHAASMRSLRKRRNDKNTTDYRHLVACNACRSLIADNPDNEVIVEWVKNSYIRMNEALLVDDYSTMSDISSEAYGKFTECRQPVV